MTKPTPNPIDPAQVRELALGVVAADRFPMLASIDGEQPLLTTRGPHKCADEGGTCKAFKGPHLYWYGAGTTWVKLELTGNVSCDSVTFTDPAPGVAKACYSDSWPDPR